MKTTKYFLPLLLAIFTACSDDLTTNLPTGPTCDSLADYDGPLAVSISMAGQAATRTETDLTGTVVDNIFGRHPFPRTTFSTDDAIGILHIVSQEGSGNYQVLQYKAVTSDGGATWSVCQPDGTPATLHHFAAHENYYFAYSPFMEGLTETDYDLSALPQCEVCELFGPMVNTTLYDGGTVSDATRKPQNTEALFNACDLLAARGTCTLDTSNGTATLTLAMDHLMGLDILMLKKWDGRVTVYDCYDTWVAPNGTIWRMKQRLEPVKKVLTDGGLWPQTTAVGGFEGMDKWLLGLDTDTCKFYLQLVKPNDGRTGYGYHNRATDGGWVVDVPPVPAGQYCVVGTSYSRHFRSESTAPYTGTYEEILFPRADERYDYDETLEVGDLLTSGGNIVKAALADGTEVGRVMWIAYGCKEFVEAFDEDEDGWLMDEGGEYLYFSGYYAEQPDDNGYRAKGREATTMTDIGEVKHFAIDYAHAAYGLSSLDDYWSHEVCNHFLVFALSDVDCGKSSVEWNEAIFAADIPAAMMFADEANYYRPALAEETFLTNKHFNTGLRSTVRAADWGNTIASDLAWTVPTIPQYEVALNDQLECPMPDNPIGITIVTDLDKSNTKSEFFRTALLSSSRLRESGEGLVLLCSTFDDDIMTSHQNYRRYTLYMGTWDGEHFYHNGLRHDDNYSYILHAPIRQADSRLPIWDYDISTKKSTGEVDAAPPTRYRPCIAY